MWTVLALSLGAVSAGAETLVAEFGPFDLPSNTLMIMPEERRSLTIPEGRLIRAVEMRSRGPSGEAVAGDRVCHNNVGPALNEFRHGRKVLLDGFTQRIEMPAGFALAPQESRFLTEVMYNNPTGDRISGVRGRLEVELVPAGERASALYPQMMSVFEQPPRIAPGHWGYYVQALSKDRRRRRFDALADASVHHVTFHIHEHGRRIILKNLTTGKTLVDAKVEYAEGRISRVPQITPPGGFALRKGDLLELIVDYDNPLPHAIDTMGAAILFGRCRAARPDCDFVAQRPVDNAWFDPKIYAGLLGPDSRGHDHD